MANFNDQDTEFIRFEESIKKGAAVADILFEEMERKNNTILDWEFLRSQFNKTKAIHIDEKQLMVENKFSALQYLEKQIDEQRTDYINDSEIQTGNVNYDHQKYFANLLGQFNISHDVLSVRRMDQFIEENKNASLAEIYNISFGKFLQRMFKVNERIRFNSGTQVPLKYTTLETIQFKNNFFFIVTGTMENLNYHVILIQKYNQKTKQFTNLLHEKLSDQTTKSFPKFGKTWIQNGNSIFFFKIQNYVNKDTTNLTLLRYNLETEESVVLSKYPISMTKSKSKKEKGAPDWNTTTSVIFTTPDLREQVENLNELNEQKFSSEFIYNQIICLTQEWQSGKDHKDQRMKVSIRSIRNMTKELAVLDCNQNPGACRVNLLHLTQESNENLNLQTNLIVCSIDTRAKIWQYGSSEGIELEDVNYQASNFYGSGLLSKISSFLQINSTQQILNYEFIQKDELTTLNKTYQQISEDDVILEDSTVTNAHMINLFEFKKREQIQETILKQYMSIFQQNFDYNNYIPSCNNINMLYDANQDRHILVIKTADSNIEILEGKMNTKRQISSEIEQQSNELYREEEELCGEGVKQLHQDFDNLFVQIYAKDQINEVSDQLLSRKIIYVDYSGKRYDVCFEESDEAVFKDFLRRHNLRYNLFSMKNQNLFSQTNRYELAEDNRNIKLRVNCQFSSALRQNGLFLELFDTYSEEVVQRINIKQLTNNADEEFNESVHKLQKLSPSSNVFYGDHAGYNVQNYQWCIIDPSKMWCQIYEFQVSWNHQSTGKERFEIIGMKLLIFKDKYPYDQNHFQPLYNSNNQIIGTTWSQQDYQIRQTRNKGLKGFNVQLQHFENKDYSVETQISSTGYKQYFTESNELKFLLVESALSHKIQGSKESFTNGEKIRILEQQIRTMLNTIPHHMDKFRQFSSDFNQKAYEVFQPFESLQCMSHLDFILHQEDNIDKLIKQISGIDNEQREEHALSIIQEFQNQTGIHHQSASLLKHDWIRQPYEISKNLLMTDSISSCFRGTMKRASAHVLIEFFMGLKQSVSTQNLLLGLVPIILDDQSLFPQFANYFIPLKPNGNNDYEAVSFVKLLKNHKLPTFSDKSDYIEKYKLEEFAGSDIEQFIENGINLRNEQIEEIVNPTRVQHYSIELSTISLQRKLLDLQNSQPIQEHTMTDLELSQIILKIVEKYPDNMENYLNIQHIINIQFQRNQRLSLSVCFFYFVVGVLPFIAQIFTLNAWYITWCNISCLFANIFLFVMEVIQFKEMGMNQYFREFANINDFSMFFIYVYYFCIRMCYIQENLSLESQKDNSEITKIMIFTILNVVILLQGLLKMTNFLKVIEEFSLVINFVTQCLWSIIPFTLLLLVWIVFLSFSFKLLGVKVQLEEYHNVPESMIYFFWTYRNIIGDIQQLNYPQWIDSSYMPALIWVVWFISHFLMMIILLQFMIALILNSYQIINETALSLKYTQRAYLNRDYFILLKVFGTLEQFDGFIISTDAKRVQYSWQDNLNSLKQQLNEQFKKNEENFTSQSTSGKNNISSEIEDLQTQIVKTQMLVKDQVGNVNKEISDLKQVMKQILINQLSAMNPTNPLKKSNTVGDVSIDYDVESRAQSKQRNLPLSKYLSDSKQNNNIEFQDRFDKKASTQSVVRERPLEELKNLRELAKITILQEQLQTQYEGKQEKEKQVRKLSKKQYGKLDLS